ncbi:PilN family type IVB pilus formation outer membrane protein, partial [Salmonella enterica]|nr:PilN family type IVB pilus formation outer membrane protein [Salmonella enterica]
MQMKKIAIALIAALSLSGCGALENINTTTHKADIDYNRGQATMDKMAHGNPVVEIHSQWINPVPISRETKSRMPGCAVTFTRPGKVTINEVLAFISKTCRIPGSVTPDAMAAISEAGGDTSQMNGKVPLPSASASGGAGNMPPLASMGGASVGASDNSLHGVFWTGDVKGLMDNVTTRKGVSWRYQGGRIQVYYLDTKNFPILFMDNQTEYTAKVVSGTTSSNGQSGGDSSSS